MYLIKRFLYLILILILSITIIGCGNNKVSDNVILTPPESYNIPLSGTWIITKFYKTNTSINNTLPNKKIGQKIYISKEKLNFLDKICLSPNFKIKTVDSTSYFASNYGISPNTLGIKQKDIKIITVTSKDIFFTSFIELNDNNLIASIDDTFFLLSREVNFSVKSKKATNKSINYTDSNINNSILNSDYETNYNSGILLGLKSYIKTSENVKKPVYRTMWFNFDIDSIKNIDELPFLLLPRKNGFWGLSTNFNKHTNLISLNTSIYPIDKIIKQNINVISSKNKNRDYSYGTSYDYNIEEILFIANNYISTLDNFYKSSNKNLVHNSVLRVSPVDTLNTNSKQSLSITKFTGDQGIISLKQGAAACFTSLDFNERKKLSVTPEDINFGVFRKEGKWILKGRLMSSNNLYKGIYKDFDIPIIPPKELIGYDALYPSWNIIKLKIPDAIDAYSSPDKHFVLVLTKNKIFIYSIKNNILSSEPKKVISLNNKETVIMAQWATGSYVKSWDDQMKKLIKFLLKDGIK